MKTVSGTMMSTKAVSLSKAARILSKFAFSDNGASPAFAAYLKRASASFEELVQFHKEIKVPGSEPKDRKKKHHSCSGVVNEEAMNSVKRPSEDNGCLNEVKQLSSELKKRVDGGKDRTKMRSDDVTVDNAMSSHGVENNIVNHDSSKDKKKKTDKDKEKNIDVASNRIASEIDGLDGTKETKVKKKRDKGKNCPPSEDAVNIEATKVQENDGSEHKKHKKKKSMEHEKEESASIVSSKQKDEAGGSGEKEKREKKEEQERADRKGDGKDGAQDRNDNTCSRKRKHKGDDCDERLDNSEEQHKSKKKKK